MPRLLVARPTVIQVLGGGLAVLVLAVPSAAGAGGPILDEVRRPDYWIGMLVAVLLGLGLFALAPRPRRRELLVLWAAKTATALGFMLAYEAHYAGRLDAFMYYEAGLGARPENQGGLSGTHTIRILSWGMQGIVGPHYHAVKILFAFAGLIGVALIVAGFQRRWPELPARSLLLVGLFPSVLFWSSILGKEPIILLGLGLVVQGLAIGGVLRRLASILAGLLVAFLVRPWIGILVAVPTTLLVLSEGVVRRWPGQPWARRMPWLLAAVFAVAGLIGLTGAWGAGFLDQVNRTRAAEAGQGGSTLDSVPTFDGWLELLLFWPWGAFTALFRPLPGEALSAGLFGVSAGLEGALLVGLTLRAVRRARKEDVRGMWFGWTTLVLGLWLAVYAYLSSVNLGTAMRYRLQVLPLILLVLLRLGRRRRAALPSGHGRGGTLPEGSLQVGLEKVNDGP